MIYIKLEDVYDMLKTYVPDNDSLRRDMIEYSELIMVEEDLVIKIKESKD